MDSESDKLDVKATRLGRAVFVKCDFEAEELVGEVVGTIIHDPDYSSSYCMDLGRGAVLEAAEPFRLLNHSCDPNCELILWRYRRFNKRRYHRVWLQTLRTIAAGEELTIDYCWPASDAIPCSCQSSRCRGWIVSPEELDQLLVTRGRGSGLQIPGQRQMDVSLVSPV